MSTKSYSKSSSFHYDEMPTQNTSLMANEFCEPWQDQWTNAHLAHTSSPWQMCYDTNHIPNHNVARTALILPFISRSTSPDLKTQRYNNSRLNMSRAYWNSGDKLQAIRLGGLSISSLKQS